MSRFFSQPLSALRSRWECYFRHWDLICVTSARRVALPWKELFIMSFNPTWYGVRCFAKIKFWSFCKLYLLANKRKWRIRERWRPKHVAAAKPCWVWKRSFEICVFSLSFPILHPFFVAHIFTSNSSLGCFMRSNQSFSFFLWCDLSRACHAVWGVV